MHEKVQVDAVTLFMLAYDSEVLAFIPEVPAYIFLALASSSFLSALHLPAPMLHAIRHPFN
jgi:hypothetical protein